MTDRFDEQAYALLKAFYAKPEPKNLQDDIAAALRAVTTEFLDCAQYDALMEGPMFKGWNRSALDRLRKKYEAYSC